MKKKKEKKKDEILEEEIQEVDKEELKKKKKKKIIIIIIVILALVGIGFYIKPFILITKKSRKTNDENISYLQSKYGENIKISFISKKKAWKYHICSNVTSYCVEVRYQNKKWKYPYGEGFIYTLLFMDEAVGILKDNNIEYKTYGNNKNTLELPSNLILVIKKDNQNSLISAIKRINDSSLISSLCVNSDDKCSGKFEIDIFNASEYDYITSKLKDNYDVLGYETFYQVLYDKVENRFGKKLGENILRHGINDDMFACNISLCSDYEYLAYRYVIGNHNYVGNTIIIEGIKK